MTTNAFRKRWPFLGASCNDAHNDCGFIAFKIIKLFISAVIIGGFLLFLFVGIGKISSYLGEKNVPELVSVGDRDTSVDSTGFSSIDQPKELALSVGLFADSEGDSANLKKAINRMEDLSVDIAFFLGDLTRWGSLEELKEGKAVLDSSDLEILVLPGDHDLAASVSKGDLLGRSKFLEVFGQNMYKYAKGDINFVLFDNSANFTPISPEDYEWFESGLATADFVILSQPLYHPTNKRVMGIVDGDIVSTVRDQAQTMLDDIRNSRVKAIISADQHFFSSNQDPKKSSLRHIVIGALVSNAEELRNPQSPRFAVLKVFSDGTYKVEEVVL